MLIALLWTTQVVWGAGQKPLIVKQKVSGNELYLTPILKDWCEAFHVRYRAIEETAWHSTTCSIEEMGRDQGDEYFVLKVEKAGTYVIEYRAEELNGVSFGGFAWRQSLTIISWGDVVWTDVHSLLNIHPEAGKPNLSQVKRLSYAYEKDFNNPALSSWDVSNVEEISFRHARAFNQNLGAWKLTKCKKLNLEYCGLDVANYSASLIGWASQEDIAHGVRLDATHRVYNREAVAAREKLIKEKGWTINGDRQLTSEHLFQFQNAKVVLYNNMRYQHLLTDALDLSALTWKVEPEGFVEISTEGKRVEIRRKEHLGSCKISASLPAKDGAHPVLQAVCEVDVVERSNILCMISKDGKELLRKALEERHTYHPGTGFKALPNNTYEIKLVSPDPTDVFKFADIRHYYALSDFPHIISKGNNTWEIKTNDWDIREDRDFSLCFDNSDEREISIDFNFPRVYVPHELNLLSPVARKEKIAPARGVDPSMKISCAVVKGEEFLSVTPDGQLTSKAVGTAQVSVMFEGYPESKKIFDVRVLDQLPITVNGVELVGDKLQMVVGGYVQLATPLNSFGWYLDYDNLPDGILERRKGLLLTDAALHGKKLKLRVLEDAAPADSPYYYRNLTRTLTIEVVKPTQPLTAFEISVNGKMVDEGAIIAIPCGTTTCFTPELTPSGTEERAIEWQYNDPQRTRNRSIGELFTFGKRPGKFRITAKSIAHPTLVRHFWVEVKAKEPTNIVLQNYSSQTLGTELFRTKNEYEYIRVSVTPADAYFDWEYEVLQTGVPVVKVEQDGNKPNLYLQTLEVGTATLVIRTKDKKLEKRLTINVLKDEDSNKLKLTLNNTTGLEVSHFDHNGVIRLLPMGGTSFYIKNPTHRILKVTANHGAQVEEDKDARNLNYYVRIAREDATVTVTEVPSCKVTLKQEGEGRLAIKDYKPKDLDAVAQGAELTVEVDPEYGYTLSSLKVGEQDILATKTFTVRENVEVKAVFKKQEKKQTTFLVTLKRGGEGKLEILGYTTEQLESVSEGTELSVTALPASGYSLTSLTAAGEDILTTKKFIVTGAVEVKAVFTKNGGTNPGGGSEAPSKYTVTLTKEGEGTLAIVGHAGETSLSITKDTELEVTAVPASGYTLASLTAGGVDIKGTKKFIVTGAVEVKAVFTKNGGTNPGGGNGGNPGGGNNGGGQTPSGNNPPKDTAVEEVALATLTVAPTPFHAQLRINNPSGVTAAYELVTLTGTVVRSGAVDGQEVWVDTETLPAGIYFVRLEASNSAKRTLKVIKY